MSHVPLDRLSAVGRLLMVAFLVGSVLIGFLALHAVSGAHGMETIASSKTHSHADDEAAHQTAFTAQSITSQSGAIAQDVSCDQRCALDNALIAMMTVLLLVLTALKVLARHPDIKRLLVGGLQWSVHAIAAGRQHSYLPSLTVLSISRT
ncbi:hypothetical protein [Mycetocola miduiensis]|uniref:Uncharacterized protein n=1 Tax=Mycetocola miduiensis TaxID=995034 RepID=A0A1I5AHK7_9MICO|nr:hypothetical protein [Mycetocola miduiensis]SFN61961.1 hypothetical protein SAMN05216219_1472 [Mycetocola miduiensis]